MIGMMTEEELAAAKALCDTVGQRLREWMEQTGIPVVNNFYALLYPHEHKRLMLREARRRARLSTQRWQQRRHA